MRTNRLRTSRQKLSPIQLVKGSIIRLGLAEKVKVRNAVMGPDGPEARIRFRLIWHRVGILCAILMVVGWVSLATTGYFFVKYKRDFPEVRYADIAFPHRWDNYRVARGDYYIAKAQKMLEAGETQGVVHLVRVGVHQSPDNKDGRMMLAQIYHLVGRPDLGIEVMRAKAREHADDPAYLGALISLMFANHDDAGVEALAMSLLDGRTEPTDRNLILAIAAATANFNRGNYDRAQEIIEAFVLTNSRTGMLLQARVDWELGYNDLAITRLEAIMTNPGDQEEQVVNYLIEYLWASGREGRAQQVAFSRFVGDPLSYAPRIRLLHIYNKRGETDRELAEIETFFRLFGQEEEAIRALGQFAAQTRQPALARRTYDHVRARGMGWESTAITVVEAHVASGHHQQALDFYEAVGGSAVDWIPLQQARITPLLVVAQLGVGNTERGDGMLNEILVSGNVNSADLMLLAERLGELGEFARAREVLSFIHVNQPLNQESLTRLIKLDIETGNNREIVRNLERLLLMRKPSHEVLDKAHRHISSDRFLFQANRAQILDSLESALVNARLQAS